MSPSHSKLCGVVAMNPDWELVGCVFKYWTFCFLKEKTQSY